MYTQINGSFRRVKSIGHPERASSWGPQGPLWGAYAELMAERSPGAPQAEMGVEGRQHIPRGRYSRWRPWGWVGVREQRAASEAAEGKGRAGQCQLWSGTATEGWEGHSEGSRGRSKGRKATASRQVVSSNFCF